MIKTICTAFLLLCSAISTVHAQLNRPLSAFSEVEVTDKINVKLVPSDRNYLELHGNLADKFEFVQQNDAVRFKMALGYQLQGGDVHITLYYTDLERIVARKGAVINNENQTLSADSLFLSANEGSKIALRLDVKRLGVNSTTGGDIQVIGETVSQVANISLGGFYYAKQLESNSASTTVNGGGRAEIYVSDAANLQTRAGGVIEVYGNPKNTQERKFAGGRITYKR